MIDFHTLNVWKKSHETCKKVYGISLKLPNSERFGLQLSLKRSAQQIPMNIAQSCGSDIDQDSIRLLKSAARVCSELEYLLILTFDLGYIPEAVHKELTEDVQNTRKMLFGYLKSIN
jgi:four helix bundle protein